VELQAVELRAVEQQAARSVRPSPSLVSLRSSPQAPR